MNWGRVFLWLMFATGWSFSRWCAFAAEAEEPLALTIDEVQVGFADAYKVGHWTPLAVTLNNRQGDALTGDLVVEVDDGDGISTTVREAGINVPSGEKTVVRTLIKPGRPQGAIRVAFESADGVIERVFSQEELPTALLATQELFVEVGRPIGLETVPRFYRENSLERPVAVTAPDASTLPRESLGYEAADWVVVTTSEPALLEAWSDPKTIAALDEWVRLGGKLILCVGREGERALRAESPLARFAPGAFQRVSDRDPGPWEKYAGAITEPMQRTEGGRVAQIVTSVLTGVRGNVELRDEEAPLVVRSAYGFGQVLFVAVDLDQPPFKEWSARRKLLLRLLGRSELLAARTTADDSNAQNIRLGYTGLTGQLRSALGQFSGARVVPFWLVFFLAICYAAVMYPLEYLAARWLRPRFEAAWLLAAVVLAGATVGIWYLAILWKGESILLNKIEVTDVDLASGTVRGQTWLGLYSPRTDAYNLRLTGADGEIGTGTTQLSWLGLPGTGLGGMNSQIAAAEQFDRGYMMREQGGLQDVPLAAWSSKAFEGRWHAAIKPAMGQLGERSLGEQPLGTLKNQTGVTLRNCVLFFENWSYQLGTLDPGGTANLATKQPVLSMRSYLTGRRRKGDKDQAIPYEPEGTELPPIVRAMLFHDAAGGRMYTSLGNRVYDRLDLTGQLRLGRAVLLATGPPLARVAVEAARGGEPQVEQEWAFYRFVIPVDRDRSTDDDQETVELRWE